VVAAVFAGTGPRPQAWGASQAPPEHGAPALEPATLAAAQGLFYNARYEAAATLALAFRSSDTDDLAGVELRTSALLFQLKGLLEVPPGTGANDRHEKNKEDALKNCAACPDLIADFFADFRRGQNLAHAALRDDPDDEAALFFLGKLNLNYVWLQLGPLRHKTGWDEYWEARRSLDAVLKANPQHVRARVARAWIDYIVDTRMPGGTRWLLGGGDRKQALADVRAAAQVESDFYTHAEAEFALWDMQVREKDMVRATESARRLALNFPENREVAAFLEARVAGSRR
jgi:hypothetical protein